MTNRNIIWQDLAVKQSDRSLIKNHQPRCIWFTGLSGAGKTTIANLLEKSLIDQGIYTYLLDSDNVRHGLNKDLGFSEADRTENIRRVPEVAHLMYAAGLVVITSFISPFKSDRDEARGLFPQGDFIEVFVQTPIQVCEARDPKGLYAKVRQGVLKGFSGIDSPYEQPKNAELIIDTEASSIEASVNYLLTSLGLAQALDRKAI